MNDLLFYMASLLIYGALLFGAIYTLIKLFSRVTSKKNSPSSRPSRQNPPTPPEKKSAKKEKRSPKNSAPSPSKEPSKSVGNESNRGFSSSEEEQAFQALLLTKVAAIGKLEAVKFVSETRGWGLKESKDYCDRTIASAPAAVAPAELPSQEDLPMDLLVQSTKELMQQKGKLEAIRFLMAETGWTLKESKKYCDRLEEELQVAPLAPKSSQPSSKAQVDLSLELDQKIQQLMQVTGWDYSSSKAYCEKAIAYKKKIAEPVRIKKNQ